MKTTLKVNFPRGTRLMKDVRQWGSEWLNLEAVFSQIHHCNGWNGTESVSGPGSSLESTSTLRAALPGLLRSIRATSMLDAPCGDFNWMKETDIGLEMYIGIDIIRELVRNNQQRYGNEKQQFFHGDITRDPLPRADIILCRDCLVHLSYKNVFSALRNFRVSGAKYLLTTTHTETQENINIVNGGWRPLNLLLEPFNFPLPEKLLNESRFDPNAPASDKHLGLWKLTDILP